MMPVNSRDRNGIFGMAGWLFADLLLVLAMFFLVSNTQAVVPPPLPTPTPLPTSLPPTPTTLPCLLRQSVQISFDINQVSSGKFTYADLLNGNQDAFNVVKRQFTANAQLQSRRAGLVLIYGGTPTVDQGGPAIATAKQVIVALQQLGGQNIIFYGTAFHDPLLAPGNTYNFISLEIYLYALTGQSCT